MGAHWRGAKASSDTCLSNLAIRVISQGDQRRPGMLQDRQSESVTVILMKYLVIRLRDIFHEADNLAHSHGSIYNPA